MRARGPEPERTRPRRRLAGLRARGVTLIEVLIVVAIVAAMSGAAVMGIGLSQRARLNRTAVMISGAVRVAYAHANATSKTARLVFDIESRSISLEESSKAMLLVRGDKTGGAADATEAEQQARAAGDAITSGPVAPRADFKAAKAMGFDAAAGKGMKELADGVRFLQIETGHQDLPETSERAYLYFWPGGQTERAAIQIAMSSEEKPEDRDVLTILVSPLTGKCEIREGRFEMAKPRTDEDESERQDTGF